VKIVIAFLIFQNVFSVSMTISVNFKDKQSFWTIEVHYVWPDAMLPTELKALKLACSQL